MNINSYDDRNFSIFVTEIQTIEKHVLFLM